MIKLFIALLMVSQLYATDTETEDNFGVSGKLMTYYSNIDYKKTDGSEDNFGITYAALQLNMNYSYENFYFQATPYLYTMTTDDGRPIKNPVMQKAYSKDLLFFRSLYMSYSIDNWAVGMGILPFSNSMPMKFSDSTIQDGVGLNTIHDNDLTSIFAKYRTENSETIFGIGTLENIIAPMGEYMVEDTKEDSMVYYIINTYENDKWTFVNELIMADMKYEKKDLNKVYTYGLGISWDDTTETGLVIYNVSGLSMLKNNSINVRSEILSNQFATNPMGVDGLTYGNMFESQYPDSFAFNTDTTYGASNLLGFRYEVDYFPLETFVNVEWFHTMGDWTSGNRGNLYNGKINQSFNIRDNSYYVNFGVLTSKNSLLRLAYTYLEFEEFGKIGAASSTIDAEDFLGGKKAIRKHIDAIHLIFTYRF